MNLSEKIIELLKSYEDDFSRKDRHENRIFFDFEKDPMCPETNNQDASWELGNRSGKYAIFNRITKQIIEIIHEENNK